MSDKWGRHVRRVQQMLVVGVLRVGGGLIDSTRSRSTPTSHLQKTLLAVTDALFVEEDDVSQVTATVGKAAI